MTILFEVIFNSFNQTLTKNLIKNATKETNIDGFDLVNHMHSMMHITYTP
jgi:hypothetical protein